ncbi:hypothetical protein ACIQZG_17810 [Lysinibacillus sp. NPDC096418]
MDGDRSQSLFILGKGMFDLHSEAIFLVLIICMMLSVFIGNLKFI